MNKVRCMECRGTGYAEPAPGFTFGNDCPVCRGDGWLGELGEQAHDIRTMIASGEAITCPRCGLDAQERYCARCKAFVDDPVRHTCRQCGSAFLGRWDCPSVCPDCFLASPFYTEAQQET
jgi:RecJ-like exonuclease